MGIASPTGRSTRTFKALCMQTKKIVFLKDTWRVISDGLLPEDQIYAKLAEVQVPHVATLEAFHNVDGQVTRTHEFQSESPEESRDPISRAVYVGLILFLLVILITTDNIS